MIITAELLNEVLLYEKNTGILYHRTRPRHLFSTVRNMNKWNTRYSGKESGRKITHKNGKSYRYVSIDNKEYLAHRIIWWMVNGKESEFDIDHIDGNGANNIYSNLRQVIPCENSKNHRLNSNNKTGIPGVYWHKQSPLWCARIYSDKKFYSLGCYKSFFYACCARKSAENKFGFHANHGIPRPL